MTKKYEALQIKIHHPIHIQRISIILYTSKENILPWENLVFTETSQRTTFNTGCTEVYTLFIS